MFWPSTTSQADLWLAVWSFDEEEQFLIFFFISRTHLA